MQTLHFVNRSLHLDTRPTDSRSAGFLRAVRTRTGLALAALLTIPSTTLPAALLAAPISAHAQDHPIVELPPAEATLDGKEFSLVQGVSELSNGRVLVSDQLEQSLYVVDFRSGEVRSLGGIGDGPGEFRSPGFLYPLGPDSTLFTDPYEHRAFLVLGDSVLETLSAASSLIDRLSAEPPWGADRSGRILGVEGFGYSGNRLAMSRVEADSLRMPPYYGQPFRLGAGIVRNDRRVWRSGAAGRVGGDTVRRASPLHKLPGYRGTGMALPGRLDRGRASRPLPGRLAQTGRPVDPR